MLQGTSKNDFDEKETCYEIVPRDLRNSLSNKVNVWTIVTKVEV